VPVLRRNLGWLGVVALVIAAVVTAGWGDGGGPPAPKQDTSTFPSVTPSGTPVADPTSLSFAQAHSLTRNVTLRRHDLSPDFVPVHAPGDGYRLTSASLHLCGATFDSEKYRLAAHRVSYRSRDGEGRVANVVIAYERGHAEQALAELEAAAPRCTRPVRPSAREQPDTLALRVRRTGPTRRDLVVERRGDVLVVLQVDGRQGYLTLDLARRLGNRLETQLP
jgi:hypothetical protein